MSLNLPLIKAVSRGSHSKASHSRVEVPAMEQNEKEPKEDRISFCHQGFTGSNRVLNIPVVVGFSDVSFCLES